MYSVKFVADEALPSGHKWALARDGEGNYYVFIKQSCVSPSVLEQAWAAFRSLTNHTRLVA